MPENRGKDKTERHTGPGVSGPQTQQIMGSESAKQLPGLQVTGLGGAGMEPDP